MQISRRVTDNEWCLINVIDGVFPSWEKKALRKGASQRLKFECAMMERALVSAGFLERDELRWQKCNWDRDTLLEVLEQSLPIFERKAIRNGADPARGFGAEKSVFMAAAIEGELFCWDRLDRKQSRWERYEWDTNWRDRPKQGEWKTRVNAKLHSDSEVIQYWSARINVHLVRSKHETRLEPKHRDGEYRLELDDVLPPEHSRMLERAGWKHASANTWIKPHRIAA